MENHTIVPLKAIAKERGIQGYYKLRKAELINALEAPRLGDTIEFRCKKHANDKKFLY